MTNEKKELCKFFAIGAMVFSLVAFLVINFSILPEQRFSEEAQVKWNQLKLKSEAHNIMITSYRECRNKIPQGTISECQMLSLNYGKVRGYENSKIIFNEIITLSDEIKKAYFKK
jgi:hypothetical protein